MIPRELRFALTASMVAEFEQRAAIGLTQPPARHWSRHYDSPACDLMKAAIVLQVCRTPEGYLQSLEAPGATGEPPAWARPVPDERLEPGALPPLSHPAGALARECLSLLRPAFDCDFERQVRLVRPQPGLRVQIACDRGEIRAGKRTEQIAEVTLERREGSPAAFYHYAMQWARLHQAQLLWSSRHLRGLLLAGLQAPAPRAPETTPCAPPSDLPVAAAARQILVGHLEHFMANIVPILGSDEPEGTHQLRGALRRFRAAIRFLDLRHPDLGKVGLPNPGDISAIWHDIDQRARALASAASLVTEAEILEAGLLTRLGKSFPDDPALHMLGRSLAVERERQRLRLRESLESPQLAAFLIDAHAAAESLPVDHWQDSSFGGFAAARLEISARRARRRVRRATKEEDWHAVGLALRSLRYALGDCRLLAMTTRQVDEAISTLARWENSLAAGRDLALARSITGRALAHTAAPPTLTLRAAALVDGYSACALQAGAPGSRAPLLAMLKQLLVRGSATAPGYHPETPAATVPETWSDGFDNGSYKEESR